MIDPTAARGGDGNGPPADPPAAAGRGVAALIRAHDWSATPLGPADRWPQSLRTIVRFLLDSRYAMWMGWGPDLTFLYNDAYARDTLANKHPWALGRPAREVWAEIWADIGPRIERVLGTGEATWDEGLLLFLERSGYTEETYHTFSYSPLYDDAGRTAGMFCVVTEETERVVAAKRANLLREVASALTPTRAEAEVFAAVGRCLAAEARPMPFTLTYLFDADGGQPRLAAATGIDPAHPATGASGWPLGEVLSTGSPVVADDLPSRFAGLPAGPWPKAPAQALLVPIPRQGQARPAGVLVAGLNPYRPLDAGYRGFIDLFVGQVAAALANAGAYAEERRRAEALAELDRAKTTFFSNVSHELRTPLTLMLGPVEDALADPATPPATRAHLDVARRNSRRLLKLVNSLLDFSRIEAGRERASFEPTDLTALTAELASVFRSAVERAGMTLAVRCDPMPGPAYVDRDMWEKVVLNLLSNAFKYTLAGGIEVRLRPVGAAAELSVRDTGIGVPPHELPHLFERFHRVEGAAGRTHEGTGIGLALVQEIVRLHGGTIRADSAPGAGSTFTVSIPLGSGHLPPDRVGAGPGPASTAIDAVAYVDEAQRWLPSEAGRESPTAEGLPAGDPARFATTRGARVVLADDNADMRDYVRRLLAPVWAVEAVPDGAAALAAARRERPDLVLSDVMMPRLDGFGLLRALRADDGLRDVPVILLSARAGEEALVEGMGAGADDYLVKPFAARELLARVGAALELARVRREGAAVAARLNRELGERVAELEALLNVLPVGIGFALDRECRTIRVNPAFAATLGVAADANVSKTAPPGERPTAFRVVDDRGREIPGDQLPMQVAAREGRAVRDVELDIVHADGRVVRLLEYAAPLFDARGEPRGCVAAFVDITDRRLAERRDNFLVRLDDATRPLTDPAAIVLAAVRLLGEHLAVDRAAYVEVGPDGDACEVIGDYSPRLPSVVGRYRLGDWGGPQGEALRADRPYLQPDVGGDPALSAAERDRYAGLQIRAYMVVPLHKAGRLAAFIGAYHAGPRRWADTEVELVRLVANRSWESIERARVARALAEREGQFRLMANSIPQLAWMARPDGSIFWYNQRWYDYTGTTFEQMQGWGWEAVHDPAELPRVVAGWRAAHATGEAWEDTFPLRRHDGQMRWHLSRALPQRGPDGQVLLWFGTNTDVTDQRRAAAEREALLAGERAARAEAERASTLKDEFLATLSHELRTPLNAILGWSHLLRRKGAGGEVAEGLAVIERNARVQVQLVEDLLDMSRIVSGKLRIDVQRVELADVIAASIESVRPAADAREVRIQTVLDTRAGPVRGDPARLQQVVWNLLSNAIKFTPKGGKVQVALERVNSHVEVTVTDTGQGIEPDFLPFVFDRFRQADGTTTRAHGGLGLGLAIVKSIVEMHGGQVRAKSPGPGRGATFSVELPLVVVHDAGGGGADRAHPRSRWGDESATAACADGLLDGLRVLVVDDDPDARELVRRVLEDCRAGVATAASAAEGFERVVRDRPDVILSDIGMPEEDGYEFLRRVRALPADRGGATPAAALTAFARSEDRRRALMAGYQSHVAKPVEPAELVMVVASLAGRVGKPRG